MSPIDVVDDDAEIPSAQPDPIDVAEDSLSGYIAAEPGRQDSAGLSDDVGSGAAPLAAAHVLDSADSVGAIGVGADADGLWAADSAGAGTPAEFLLTQAYDDDGVKRVGSADPPANMPALAEAEADPIANIPALAEVEENEFANMPSLDEGVMTIAMVLPLFVVGVEPVPAARRRVQQVPVPRACLAYLRPRTSRVSARCQ